MYYFTHAISCNRYSLFAKYRPAGKGTPAIHECSILPLAYIVWDTVFVNTCLKG